MKGDKVRPRPDRIGDRIGGRRLNAGSDSCTNIDVPHSDGSQVSYGQG